MIGAEIVVVGGGIAGQALVEALRARDPEVTIALVCDEPELPYDRVRLSELLISGEPAAELRLRPDEWYADAGVQLIRGRAAWARPDRKLLGLYDGTLVGYDRLALATGSKPLMPPIEGIDLEGVHAFRDPADCEAIRAAAGSVRHAAVIGGGLLGLEAARGIAAHGCPVTVVHLMDRLMERQLDARAAAMLRRAMEAKGIEVHLEAATAAIRGVRHAEAVELADRRTIKADLVVVVVGVRPNVELARTAGLRVDRGIVVDDRLQSSRAGIHAIGECAEHRGVCYGLVEPAYEQARVLAQRLAGDAAAAYSGSVLATNLKVSGINVFSAGDFLGAPGTETIVLSDPGLDTYKKLVIADGRLVGAVLYGDTEDGLWYLDLIRSGVSIERMRGDLAFGRVLAERMAA